MSTSPRVTIFLYWEDYEHFNEDRATRVFLYELSRVADTSIGNMLSQAGKSRKAVLDELLSLHFSGIRVVALPPVGADTRHWQSLRFRLIQESGEIQNRRKNCQVAFSAPHFKAFLQLSCVHFASDIVSPFNFAKASRMHNPLPSNYQFHLTGFLKSVQATQISNFAVRVIASALMCESYPPRMHCKLCYSLCVVVLTLERFFIHSPCSSNSIIPPVSF